MSALRRPRRHIIAILVGGLIAVQFLMVSMLVANSARLIHDSHAELFNHNSDDVITLLGQSLIPGLVTRDRAALRDSLELLRSNQNIVYAAVYDASGTPLASIGVTPKQFTRDAGFHHAHDDSVVDLEQDIVLEGQTLGRIRAGFSIRQVEALTRRTIWESALIVATEMLFTITAAILVGAYLVRRIRSLTAGAVALRNGQLDHRIAVSQEDELSAVGEAFNQLAEYLQITQDALRKERDALEIQIQRTATLLDGVNAVIFEMSGVPLGFSFLSGSAMNLQGYSLDEWRRPGFWERVVDPRDRHQVEELFERWQSRIGDFVLEFRVRNRRNETRWLRQIGTVTHEQSQVVLRGLFLDVTEEKSVLEMQASRDRALEANKAKSAFIASMSHELRTPLNAIIGYSEMIRDELRNGSSPSADALSGDLKRIHDSGKHLLAMINDILDFSKLEAGKFQLHCTLVDTASLVRNAADMILPLAQGRKNEVRVEIDDSIPPILADEKRLFQILVNLLSNACKFTVSGHISIRVRRDTFNVYIEVADTGIGIRTEDLPKLFQEFSQVDLTRTRRSEGTGLGLAISQRLTRLMGGEITVHSIYGQGSTFRVALPLEAQADVNPAAAAAGAGSPFKSAESVS